MSTKKAWILFQVLWVLIFVIVTVENWLLAEERDAWRETAHRATNALEVCVTQYQDANALNGDLLRYLRHPPPPPVPDEREFPVEQAD